MEKNASFRKRGEIICCKSNLSRWFFLFAFIGVILSTMRNLITTDNFSSSLQHNSSQIPTDRDFFGETLPFQISYPQVPNCETSANTSKGTISLGYKNVWTTFMTGKGPMILSLLKDALKGFGLSLCLANEARHPDIMFYSLGSLNIPKRTRNLTSFQIFFSGENFELYTQYKTLLHDHSIFDVVISHEHDNESSGIYRIPIWFYFIPFFERGSYPYQVLQLELQHQGHPRKLNDRLEKVTMVSSHAKRGTVMRGNLRTEIFDALVQAGVSVDSPGRLRNNMPSIEAQGLTKLEHLEKYMFNLCPENSMGIGYTTEKMPQAVVSGAIPIYWGDPACDHGVFNRERILYFKEQEDPKNVAERVKALLDDRDSLQELFDRPLFSPNVTSELVSYLQKYHSIAERIWKKFQNRSTLVPRQTGMDGL